MISTKSLYEMCRELFAEYPLAVDALDESGLIRSMVLMLPEGADAQFFVLAANLTGDGATFSLGPWHVDNAAGISGDANAYIKQDEPAVDGATATALARGVPIPRDGSLFGWVYQGAVTSLIGVQAHYTAERPLPAWAVMPLASTLEAQWPPFAGDRLLGSWFWECHRARTIVLLDDLIATTSNLVFWVDTKDILGSDSCAVASDINSDEGFTLPRGRYVYYEALRANKPVPSLDFMLADPRKIDLGPQFQLPECSEDEPEDER